MCRWALGTVDRRFGVLLDPNSGVVKIHLSSEPPEIETFFFPSQMYK